MSLIGANNEEKIWNFLKAQGLSDCGAAGLMGNLYAESALNSTNLQNTYEKKFGMTDAEYTAAVDSGKYTNFVRDSAGYGLAQWTYWSRKQALLDYVKAAGKSIGDLEAQLGYLIKELGSYGLLNTMKSVQSVREASNVILLQFEKPASKDTKETQDRRAGYSQTYYDKYAGKTTATAAATVATASQKESWKSMALLTPNAVAKIPGVTVNEKIIPDGTRWQDAAKAAKAGFSANALYKKQQKLSGGTGKVQFVTIHNTNDLPNVNDDGEQYTRATYNQNMGSARVHFYVDDTGAWQNLRAGTGLYPADPVGSAEVSWHSGDGSVETGGNMTSLSMEIIMNESPEHDLIAKENGAKIAAWLLWKHGLGIDKLVTHTYWVNKSAGKSFGNVDDQCCNPISGKKWCPTYIFGSTNPATAKQNWLAFKALVQEYMKDLSGKAVASAQSKPVQKSSAEAVLAIAIGEIGYLEKNTNSQLDDKAANAGNNNWTKYARDFDEKYPNWYNGKKNGYAWCDMFVDWCFLTAFGYTEALRLLCQPEKSGGAGCTYSLAYYKQKGQYHSKDPKPGDQIFFGSSISNVGHTGIVEKVDGSKVYTIEGNTSDKVARRTYALTDPSIVGYGRPAYGVVSSTPTAATSSATIVPYTVRIDRSDLNIRTGAGSHTASKGYIKPGVYTIVAESDGPGASKWGQLKSGAGWVSLDYCTKLGAAAPAKTVSEADQAIDKLAKLGVINSPDYWKKTVGTVQFLDQLFIKAAAKITGVGPRSASVMAGVEQLVKDGIINTPSYWLEHHQDCPNLGALLCALGGAKKG